MAQPLFETATVCVANLLETVTCVESGTVSKTLINEPGLKQVLFAMDAGQELSQHRAPFLAIVQVLDGTIRMHVDGRDHTLGPASWLLLPPDMPHDVCAIESSRFLLTLARNSQAHSRDAQS